MVDNGSCFLALLTYYAGAAILPCPMTGSGNSNFVKLHYRHIIQKYPIRKDCHLTGLHSFEFGLLYSHLFHPLPTSSKLLDQFSNKTSACPQSQLMEPELAFSPLPSLPLPCPPRSFLPNNVNMLTWQMTINHLGLAPDATNFAVVMGSNPKNDLSQS